VQFIKVHFALDHRILLCHQQMHSSVNRCINKRPLDASSDSILHPKNFIFIPLLPTQINCPHFIHHETCIQPQRSHGSLYNYCYCESLLWRAIQVRCYLNAMTTKFLLLRSLISTQVAVRSLAHYANIYSGIIC
jgi:hypothetical protein